MNELSDIHVMKTSMTFEKFKQIYNDLICENAPGLIDADEAQYLIDHPANQEIVKAFKRFFQSKLQKLNKKYGLNVKIEYELFEPKDEEDYQKGENTAHVNENDPLKILINLFWLAHYIDNDMTISECIYEYDKEHIIEHEYAHVLDILENGKRPFEDQHNSRWKELFDKILKND